MDDLVSEEYEIRLKDPVCNHKTFKKGCEHCEKYRSILMIHNLRPRLMNCAIALERLGREDLCNELFKISNEIENMLRKDPGFVTCNLKRVELKSEDLKKDWLKTEWEKSWK